MKKILPFFFIVLSASVADAQYWMQAGGSPTIDEGMDVASDGFGNTYTTGYFSSVLTMDNFTLSSAGLNDVFIVKTDSTGIISWMKSAGGANIDRALSIDADNAGNTVITGYFYQSADFDGQVITSSGQQDIFIAKYDSAGVLLWVKSAGGTSGDAGNSVAFDNSGNVIVTGEFSGNCSFGTATLTSLNGSLDVFTAKYDSNGNLLWTRKGSGKYTDRGIDVCPDAAGNIYVSGMFSDTITFDIVHNNPAYNAMFLIKYNTAGTEQWFRWMASALTNGMEGMAVHNNDIDLTGNFSGTLYFYGTAGSPPLNGIHTWNIFLLRYDLQGNLVWRSASGSESEMNVQAIEAKNNGEVVIAGNFKCRLEDFSAQYGAGIFCSIGYSDTYIASYDNSGNWLWARQFGGRQDDFVNGISFFNDSLISATGSFRENFIAPISPLSFTGHGNYTSYNTGIINYCLDNNYASYIRYNSNGDKDIFINSNVDLSRQPYDYFERSGTICNRPFNDICIVEYGTVNCTDSLIKCGNTILDIDLHIEEGISPALAYLWNTLDITDTIHVDTSGYYTITVTSYDGCFSNTDSIYFLTHPFPATPTISDSKGINVNALTTDTVFLCLPDSVQLMCTNGGGNNVQWYNFPAGQNPVTVNTTGIYLVTVTNSYGCPSLNSVYVQADTGLFSAVIPNVTCQEDTDGNDSLVMCLGESFHMFVYDSISNPQGNSICFPQMTYAQWSTPSTFVNWQSPTSCNSSPAAISMWTPVQPGDFDFLISVWVHRISACDTDVVYTEKLIHVTVYPVPDSTVTVFITGPATLCPGNPVMLIAMPPGYSYIWSTGETTDTIYVTQAGNYSVSTSQTVTNSYGCQGIIFGFNFITITAILPPLIYTIPSDGTICPGDSVIIACLGPGTFSWYGPNGVIGGTTNYVYVTTPGNYYCIETFAPGCDLFSNTVPVNLYSTPFIDGFPDAYLCGNDSVILNVIASQNSLIQWLPPLSGSSFTQVVYTPGVYSCNVTSCGITTPLTFTVTSYPSPAAPVISLQPPNLVSTPATGYQWYFNGVLINGATSQTYFPLQNGSYTVEITDSNGCPALSAPYVLSNVGIQELSDNEIIISPNPVKSFLQIIFTSENFIEGKTIICIRNILGEELLKITAHEKETISLNNFSNGMYLVEVRMEKKILKRKILVNH